jgi:phosphate transport system permease protein
MSPEASAAELSARFGVSPARRRKDMIARGAILGATIVALIPLVLIIYYLLKKGLGAWSSSFFTTDPTGNTFFKNSDIGGIKSAILGRSRWSPWPP